ncbi:MAG: MarR family transcriptional regulator [Candidatus Zixiibacteriota bacterium]
MNNNSVTHEEMLGHILGSTGKLLRARFDQRLSDEKIGVNSMQAIALLHIIVNNGDCNQQQVADCLHQDKTMITRIIDSLEKGKFVRREIDSADRRQKLLQVTSLGRKLHETVNQVAQEIEKEALKNIGQQELLTCYQVLEKVRNNLSP